MNDRPDNVPTVDVEGPGRPDSGRAMPAAIWLASDVARANWALHRGISRLRSARDTAEVLAAFMAEAVAASGAAAGAVLQRTGRTRFEMLAIFAEGALLDPSAWRDDPMVARIAAVSQADPAGYWAGVAAGQHRWCEVTETYGGWFEENVEFHSRLGHRFLWDFPLRIGDEVVGMLGLAFREGPEPGPVAAETVRTLANATSLALELSRLSDTARDAAVAREREAAEQLRVDELARANEALARSAARFAAAADEPDVLAIFLEEAITVAGATGGGVLLRLPGTSTGFAFGAIRRGNGPTLTTPDAIAADALEVAVRRVTPLDAYGAFAKLAAGEPRWQRLDEVVPRFPEAAAYHARYGTHGLWDVPFGVGGQIVGYLGLTFAQETPPGAVAAEAVRALSNQAAVALALTRAATEARRAALAEAQERAARERAEALARIGEAGRATLAQLASEPSLDCFLAQVLRTAASAFDADSGAIWVQDGTTLRLAVFLEAGVVHSMAPRPGLEAVLEGEAAEVARARVLGQQRGCIQVTDAAAISGDPALASWRDTLLRRGIRTILGIPMLLGETYRGSLTLRFTADRRLSAEEAELACGLANQALLALELTRLADIGREAAVARVRETAAIAAARTLERQVAERTRELAEANDVLDGIIQALPVGFAHFNRELRYERVNRALCEVKGLPEAAHLGRTVRDVLPQLGVVIEPLLARVLADGRPIVGHQISGRASPSGPERDWVASFYPLRDQYGTVTGVGSVVVDVTELKRREAMERDAAVAREREAAMEARAAELAQANLALRGALDVLSSDPTLEPFLGHALRTARELCRADATALWLFDTEADLARISMLCDADGVRPATLTGQSYAAAPGLMRKSAPAFNTLRAARRPVWIAMSEGQVPPRLRSCIQAEHTDRACLIPMTLGQELLGCISLRFSDASRGLSAEQLELAQALAHQAALAVYLDRLHGMASAAMLAEERRRFAREIHDTLAQGFAAIAMKLTAAEREYGTRLPVGASSALASAGEIAREHLVEARRALGALAAPRHETLAVQLARLVDAHRRGGESRVMLEADAIGPLPDAVAHELVRMAQEAVSNALRHGRPTRVRLELTAALGGGLRLGIEDDGSGFDTSAEFSGYGLSSMRARAASIGAVLTVVSAPGEGSEVIVTWHPDGRKTSETAP